MEYAIFDKERATAEAGKGSLGFAHSNPAASCSSWKRPGVDQIVINLLDQAAKSALVVLAAFAAVHFAFKRFTRETLWTRKLEAYTKILEALHFSLIEAEERYDMAGREHIGQSAPQYTDEYKQHRAEREKAAFKAQDEMKKILTSGNLIISKAASGYLTNATKPRYDDWMHSDEIEFWETEQANLRELIVRVNAFAREDLELETDPPRSSVI